MCANRIKGAEVAEFVEIECFKIDSFEIDVVAPQRKKIKDVKEGFFGTCDTFDHFLRRRRKGFLRQMMVPPCEITDLFFQTAFGGRILNEVRHRFQKSMVGQSGSERDVCFVLEETAQREKLFLIHMDEEIFENVNVAAEF